MRPATYACTPRVPVTWSLRRSASVRPASSSTSNSSAFIFCQTQRGLIAGLFLGFSAQFIHPLLGGIVGVGLAALPVTCLVVAWGLVDYAPWACTYAIIVSAIWLLDFPLGTALSIYTLWVLLPESSESERSEEHTSELQSLRHIACR